MLPRLLRSCPPRLSCRVFFCHNSVQNPFQIHMRSAENHTIRYAIPSRSFTFSTRRSTKESLKEVTIEANNRINVKLKPSEFRRLLALAGPEKWTLAGALGFLVISSSVTMAVPFSLGKVLDVIYSTPSTPGNLNTLCLVLCGVFLVGGLSNFCRVYLMSVAGQRMTQSLRRQVFAGVMRQETAWFGVAGGSAGELVNRLSADTQLVGRNLSQNLSDGLRSTFMVCAGTGMMLYLSPALALVGLCVVPPVAVLAVIFGRFVRSITKQMQDALAITSKLAEEKISNIKTVKAFSQEDRECERYNKKIETVLTLAYKEALAVGSFYGMTGLSGNTIIILVLYYGGSLVASGDLSVGALTSFLLYAAYVGISVGGLSSAYTDINRGLGAATRLWEILDRKPAIPVSGGRRPTKRPHGEFVLENVTFCYGGAPLLKNFNLTLHAGQSLALVGKSGCGKSTVAALLLRLYDPIEGRVLLDGVDIRELDPMWLRSHIGYVGQEPVLFSGSIKENILYGVPEEDWSKKLPGEEVPTWVSAAKAAQLQELLRSDGGEREVGDRGGQLSGGQKQRVAIARAIVKNPKILILDEATSALDARSESLVTAALAAAARGGERTVLTVAHRLSTVRSANEVAVLSGGAIIERGLYSDLIERPDGALRELMASQAFLTPAPALVPTDNEEPDIIEVK